LRSIAWLAAAIVTINTGYQWLTSRVARVEGLAPVSTLAPYLYLQLSFATLAGWLVFSHRPDGWALAGIGVIAVSGVAAVSGRPPLARRPVSATGQAVTQCRTNACS
jgi:drug/metabolite transporter (DMT)-like permease